MKHVPMFASFEWFVRRKVTIRLDKDICIAVNWTRCHQIRAASYKHAQKCELT
jgi:hypothetical protein